MGKKIFNKGESVSFLGDSLKLVKSKRFKNKYEGKINLIFTSPPFNLILKKKYGNEYGDEYVKWFSEFSTPLTDLLTDDGFVVLQAVKIKKNKTKIDLIFIFKI